MTGFMLYFQINDKCIEYPLLAVSDRQIEIDLNPMGVKGSISIEVWDDAWSLLENIDFDVYEPVNGRPELAIDVQLEDNKVIFLVAKRGDIKICINVFKMEGSFIEYDKYMIDTEPNVVIGSSSDCHIKLGVPNVQLHHVALTMKEGKRYIVLYDPHCKVYLNGVLITQPVELRSFDNLYISGVKLIYLDNILALNRGDKVESRLNTLTAFAISDMPAIEVIDDTTFSRAPRVLLPYDDEEISIEAPPNKKRDEEMPWIFTIGPSITMPMPMITSALVNMNVNGRGASSYIGIMVSMLMSACIGVAWAVARGKYKKKKDARDEAFRVEQYTKYIQLNEELIQEKVQYNKEILESQYFNTSKLLLCINDGRNKIWNRNIYHKDFLTVSLGVGWFLSPTKIKTPENRFSLDADNLIDQLYDLRDKYEYIPNEPSLLPIKEHKIIGILGDYLKVHNIAKNIILQLAAMHSYTDVKIVVLYDESESSLYDWVKWLPHTFTSDKKLRFVGNTEETRDHVIQTIIKDLMNRRNELSANSIGTTEMKMYPYRYVIVCTSDRVFTGNTLNSFMTSNEDLGVHFILAYATTDGLPNECKALIESDSAFSGFFTLEEPRDKSSSILFDEVHPAMPEWFSRKISGLTVKEAANGEIPVMVDYLGSLGVGKLEQWDLVRKYKENRAYEGIKAFLGVGSGGKPLILDVHEKKHGPHGLVAGTTGSGKSETLQTAIASWILNYSPEEVAFVLIDYKGGGMANAFIGVPHLAGTITNISDDEETSANKGNDDNEDGDDSSESLDTNQTRRALVAIKAEIRYRQTLFKNYSVNHIDAYMKLYRKGSATEPLPHLIIISDEFAELKKEQPAFIKELVSAARVGRSLGVHLILATQKPANSVDDEIWANSRFKICLRVQDKTDSQGMLHRPEAAFLTQTGRGYFQLGNNEIFEEFQTAYSGADYIAKSKIELPEDSICKMIELDGTDTPIDIEHEVRPDNVVSQLTAALQYVTAVCKRNGIAQVRQLCAAQLTKKMYLSDILEKLEWDWSKGLYACVGLIDDPDKQTQHLAMFNLVLINNLYIAGTQGYGKTTFLQTFLYSIVSHYTPNQVNFYIMDYSSRTLKIFNTMRHCGDVTVADDSIEKPQRLFKLIRSEINARKALFEESSVGSYAEYIRIKQIPLILVVIDNIAVLFDQYAVLEETFQNLTRDCVKYGIQFIVTGNKLSDLKYKMRSNFLDFASLNVPKGDLRELFSTTVDWQIAPYRGRGMFFYKKRLLEYQVALATHGASELERTEALVSALAELHKQYDGYTPAKAIPIIPKNEVYKEFYDKAYKDKKHIPLGYNMADISISYIDLTEVFCFGFSVSTADVTGILIGMSNTLYAIKKMGYKYDYLQFDTRSKPIQMGVGKDHIIKGQNSLCTYLKDFQKLLFERITERSKLTKQNPEFDYGNYLYERNDVRVIFIDSCSEFVQYMEISGTFVKLATSADLQEYPEEKQASVTTKVSDNNKVIASDIITTFKMAEGLGLIFVIGYNYESITTPDIQRTTLFKNCTAAKAIYHLGGNLDVTNVLQSNATITEKKAVLPKNVAWTVKEGKDIKYHLPTDLLLDDDGNND